MVETENFGTFRSFEIGGKPKQNLHNPEKLVHSIQDAQ